MHLPLMESPEVDGLPGSRVDRMFKKDTDTATLVDQQKCSLGEHCA